MKVKISMLIFVFALFSGALMAQTKVTGTVTGGDGMPLPSVSVVIKGTTRGVSQMRPLSSSHWGMLLSKKK